MQILGPKLGSGRKPDVIFGISGPENAYFDGLHHAIPLNISKLVTPLSLPLGRRKFFQYQLCLIRYGFSRLSIRLRIIKIPGGTIRGTFCTYTCSVGTFKLFRNVLSSPMLTGLWQPIFRGYFEIFRGQYSPFGETEHFYRSKLLANPAFRLPDDLSLS